MLTQQKADHLLQMPKRLVDSAPVRFPISGNSMQLEAKSQDGREAFMLDVNRKGKIKLPPIQKSVN